MIDTPDDAVILVCMRTAEQDYDPVPGSVVVPCGNCGQDCWRAPGPAFAGLDGDEKRIKFLSPFHSQPAPTVILCLSCAQTQYLLSHGTPLPDLS